MDHSNKICSDKLTADLDLEEVYFLGAGASISSGIPLTKQFFPYLLEQNLNDERLSRLKQFISDLFPHSGEKKIALPKFEHVLSILDLALLEDHELRQDYERSTLGQLRNDLDYLIWKMLEQSSRKTSSLVFKEFANSLDPKKHLLMALNYDTLLDHALISVHGSVDYGVRFSGIYGSRTPNGPNTPLYLKLHGSINWLQCPNCQSFYCYQGAEELSKIFDDRPELCPYDNGYLRGIIVSPTWNKRYTSAPLSLLWIKASKLLRNIRKITFIGYSLSDVDMRVIYLLKRSLFNNPNKVDIRVVDPDETGKIFTRYERLLGPIEAIQSTFREFTTTGEI